MTTVVGPDPAPIALQLWEGASCTFYVDKTVNGVPSSYTGSEVVTAVVCGTEFTGSNVGARSTIVLDEAAVTTALATQLTDAAVWYDNGTDKEPVYAGQVIRHP